ncbi:MAG: hypothetical protein H7A43_00180 [Verrucomicrobia bacterium]|nr:hypothetical protein [Kiritimatiellia bacterium]MCP5487044.1 hypothetical protein [Verrucomicrobiota bacterium]
MYQYPMLNRAVSFIRRLLVLSVVLIVFFFAFEWFRLLLLLRRVHPLVGLGGMILTALVLLWMLIRHLNRRADHQTLRAGGFRTGARATHRDLRAYCRYLIQYITRLSNHPYLQEETSRILRQQAADIDEVLASHPLNDDLYRTIQQVEEILLPNAFDELDRERKRLTMVKVRAVIEDANQPPFPVIVPLVILYHQITLISLVVDCFVTRASLGEYLLVIRDVWQVMTKGDFIRLGQRLFEGVYINSPPMGMASNDLGQAISTIWMTHSISNAAALRCRTIHSWTLKQGIADMEGQTVPTLNEIREEWMRSVMPLLKIRIRHSAPPGTEDTAGFSESVVRGITKSIDHVVQGLSSRPMAAAQPSRPLAKASTAYPKAAETIPPPSARKIRRRRKHRRRYSPWRLLGLFSQRFKYRNGPDA